MKAHCVLAVVPWALFLATPASSQVRLTATPASPGGTIEFQAHSPYPESPYSIQALSPTGHAFEIASGTTDSAGRAIVDVGLVDELPLSATHVRMFAFRGRLLLYSTHFEGTGSVQVVVVELPEIERPDAAASAPTSAVDTPASSEF